MRKGGPGIRTFTRALPLMRLGIRQFDFAGNAIRLDMNDN